MFKQSPQSIEEVIEKALDVVCVVEDILSYEISLVPDASKKLVFAITLYRLSEDSLLIHIPAFAVYSMSRQMLVHHILNACGWIKVEV